MNMFIKVNSQKECIIDPRPILLVHRTTKAVVMETRDIKTFEIKSINKIALIYHLGCSLSYISSLSLRSLIKVTGNSSNLLCKRLRCWNTKSLHILKVEDNHFQHI